MVDIYFKMRRDFHLTANTVNINNYLRNVGLPVCPINSV